SAGYTNLGNYNAFSNAQIVLSGNGLNVPETILMTSRITSPFTAPQIENSSGNNTLSGNIFLVGSATTIQHVIQSDGGTLTISGSIAADEPGGTNDPRNLVLTGAGSGKITGTVSDGTGPVRIVKGGTGSWTLTNSGNFFTAGTSVNDGALNLDYTNDSGAKLNGFFSPLALAGGTLQLI